MLFPSEKLKIASWEAMDGLLKENNCPWMDKIGISKIQNDGWIDYQQLDLKRFRIFQKYKKNHISSAKNWFFNIIDYSKKLYLII